MQFIETMNSQSSSLAVAHMLHSGQQSQELDDDNQSYLQIKNDDTVSSTNKTIN